MPPLKKNEKIMLILIGAAVIFFVVMDPYYIVWRTPPGAEAPPPLVQTVKTGVLGVMPAASAKGGPVRPVTELAREKIPLEGWGRDPFMRTRGVSDRVNRLDELRLGVISVRGDERYALINSRVVRVGDEIAGFRIARIEKDRVILTLDGQDYLITWEE